MRVDYILTPKTRKVSSDVIASIRKDRKAGITYRELARKYKLSFSYCYYLCLNSKDMEKYRERMSDTAKRYYEQNRCEIIRKNCEHTKKVRAEKRKLILKKEKAGCYIGRRTNL